MTKQYTFDFRRMTWRDFDRVLSGSVWELLMLYDRVTVGGVMDLSLNHIAFVVAPQFKVALDEWLRHGRVGDAMPKPQVFDAPTEPDDATLRDLLDGIEGL